jgi:hypothetical protein
MVLFSSSIWFNQNKFTHGRQIAARFSTWRLMRHADRCGVHHVVHAHCFTQRLARFRLSVSTGVPVTQ